ncbi:FAD-dependent oxidoreductase [Pseudaminobacter sp. 19-2017]|uniref:FAD-dependent oxidoreductase n=1 Tax=Pseudaminobacter soli (ex Zhang et al. 2022) TaxID=2831468 RepID=A0A942E3A6_9HYPH|nr:NAD(P)/FAD-dependent oxidoreductase [Pseudaminobacter soli]MBS3650216.1 FAD-dependent oxidoreductase [Pseudaminobacter soli]
MTGKRIIVVGAGIAGLVAARRLSQAGHSVRVLEAAEVAGGRVGDREIRGIRFNAGARLVYGFSPPFNALLDEVGLTEALVPVRRLSAECVGTDGRWTVELMPSLQSLLTPGLSVGERLRFLSFGLNTLAARRSADPDDAASMPAADGVTLADHIRTRLGPNVLERMLEPIFRGTRSWNPEEVSAAFFASTAPHLVGHDTVHVFKGGMGRLPDALARGLAIDCATRVVAVEMHESGPCHIRAERNGDAIGYDADLVICATEGSVAAALFPDLPPDERVFLAGVRYNSLGIVHYRLNRQVEPKMQFFTREAANTLTTWQQVPGNEATGQAPQLYAQLSPEATHEAKGRGMTDRLDEVVSERVRELYPSLDRDCVDRHGQWIERMLPLFYPGYGRAMAAFRDRQSATRRRVYFCGDYLAQALVTGAAASGERAARDIARHWGGG